MRTLIGMITMCIASSTALASTAYEDTVVMAASLGLTPECIAAIGAEESAALCLTRIHTATELRSSIVAQRAAVDQALAEVSELATLMRTSSDAAEALQDYADAQTALQNASADLRTLEDQLIAVALDGHTEQTVLTAARWRANSRFAVPAEFRVLMRTDDEWRSLERAVRAERRAIRRGQTLSGPTAELLLDVRIQSDVMGALASLALFLDDVRDVFEAFGNQ